MGEIRSSSGEKIAAKRHESGLIATGDTRGLNDSVGEVKNAAIGAIVSSGFPAPGACFNLLRGDDSFSLGLDRTCCFLADQSAKSDEGSPSKP